MSEKQKEWWEVYCSDMLRARATNEGRDVHLLQAIGRGFLDEETSESTSCVLVERAGEPFQRGESTGTKKKMPNYKQWLSDQNIHSPWGKGGGTDYTLRLNIISIWRKNSISKGNSEIKTGIEGDRPRVAKEKSRQGEGRRLEGIWEALKGLTRRSPQLWFLLIFLAQSA